MKKLLKAISLVSTLLLLSTGTFFSCSSDDDDDNTTETSKPAEPQEDSGKNQDNNNGGNNNSGNENNNNGDNSGNGNTGNNEGDNGNTGDGNTGNDTLKPSDLTSYHKAYFFGGSESDTKIEVIDQDGWGSGSVKTDGANGSVNITAGSGWGTPSVSCLAYGNIIPGYLARYTHIVLTADLKDFELSTGESANDNANIKIASPDAMTKLTAYANANTDGTVTYILPVSELSSAATATQIAIIFGGTGTVKFTEFYVASKDAPAIDKTALSSAISAANEIASAAVVGESVGNYTQASLDTFNLAISTAKAVSDKADATQTEIDNARATLLAAETEFAASVIVASDAVPSALAAIENTPAYVVFSSTVESNTAVTDWAQGWGGSPTWSDYTFTVDNASKTVKKLTTGGWFGLYEFKANGATISTAAKGNKHMFFHIDLYTKDAVAVKPVVSVGESGAGEKEVSTEAGEYGWKAIDVDLTKLNASENAFMFQLGFGPMTDVYVDNIYLYEKEIAPEAPVVTTLPVLQQGNSATKIEGAGIWIYLDNTNLEITGANAADIVSASTITVKDHASGDAVTVNSWEFNDYGDSPKSVRLFGIMQDATHTTIDVDIALKIGANTYTGTVNFVDGEFKAE
ncbi:hypothetical protein [uncultured Treponema sp.]|uniref:hypothetical protein n=1 Tax=uncultured Treponema sp. TaxID=162155 RepID=UPI0025CC8F23|nr:hypothetical protein [uncultured Treponema sp.]